MDYTAGSAYLLHTSSRSILMLFSSLFPPCPNVPYLFSHPNQPPLYVNILPPAVSQYTYLFLSTFSNDSLSVLVHQKSLHPPCYTSSCCISTSYPLSFILFPNVPCSSSYSGSLFIIPSIPLRGASQRLLLYHVTRNNNLEPVYP
jgi:hypothetical protein